ncbi:hypothetical protein [Nonomuraea soli]|uniref:DUF3558 domain-containing protein n=1 Tax=Nonomuraea soli TaxID=1032476 RepID=A0A7W0HV02_9ACTN|nr:hypothetical protein [Nonomuraea soli]MBA2896276.1 hypothetical protein [Nonomuraea soli]
MTRPGPIVPALALLSVALLTGCSAPSTEDGGCPLATEDLDKETSLRWQLREKHDSYPLETTESIKAMVCLYTAADAPQQGDDPLTMRTDLVEGPEVDTVRKSFEQTCAGNAGRVREVSRAQVCDKNGSVVDGLIAMGDRAVNVYWVNADMAIAVKLTPSFERIVAMMAGNRG